MTSYMNNISLLMTQPFRTKSICFYIIAIQMGKKLKSDVKMHIFQNVTSLVMSLRDVIAMKIVVSF